LCAGEIAQFHRTDDEVLLTVGLKDTADFQAFPPGDDDEGIPAPDEAETASLSPDQVRRILDRVESLLARSRPAARA